MKRFQKCKCGGLVYFDHERRESGHSEPVCALYAAALAEVRASGSEPIERRELVEVPGRAELERLARARRFRR